MIGLGSNVGDRYSNLMRAVRAMSADGKIILEKTSSIYETSPVGVLEQPTFLNAVVEGITALDPFCLLQYLKDIEDAVGREKTYRWGPRVIDLDIILYGDLQMQTDGLTIPHAEMKNRAFVLIPLAEIEPDLVLPDGTPIRQALQNLSEEDTVTLRKDILLTLS